VIVDDLRAIDQTVPIEADLCIVGSGPAGCAIAECLSETQLRIVVLESGGIEPEPEAQALNQVKNVGAPLFNGRERCFGGTSSVWAGRCIAFDDIDFEQRDWVPLSGWPFGPDTVSGYVDRAARYLGAAPANSEDGRPRRRSPDRLRVDPSVLSTVCWQDIPPVNVSQLLSNRRNENLRVLLHATVTQINTDAAGRAVESVEVASAPDDRVTVTTAAVVLCAGGVENARILLYSNRVRPEGIGNAHDLVGRYFMDHPRDPDFAVSFAPQDAPRIRKLLGPYRRQGTHGPMEMSYGLALSPDCQRREGLPNCAAWPFEVEADDDPIRAAQRLLFGPRTDVLGDAQRLLSEPGIAIRELLARATGQRMGRKVSRTGLLIASEQLPNPESRIRLSAQRDHLGLPISEINWRIAPQEKAAQAALARAISREFQRLGLPRADLAGWVRDGRLEDAALVDGCHPSGTTRMADDPRVGVVDADCQVHGVRGLYVAGSSIFPTAGHANPTQMIVALAFRLADHLAERVSRPEAVRRSETPRPEVQQKAPSLPPETGVAVTGATGFIGRRLVERLVEQGVHVLCLTRDEPTGARLVPAGARTHALDLATPEHVSEALDGMQIIFHCAYDWDNEGWNLRALRALIDGCRTNGCRRLIHLSSFVVYELPREGELTESCPAAKTQSGYAHVKRELERELLSAARGDGIQASILQPTIVYGPRSRPWAENPADMLRYGTVALPDDRAGLCNAVYVDDVVDGMLCAATHPGAVGERFLLSGPEPVTWAEFYTAMAKAVGARGPRYLPAERIAQERGRVRKLLDLAAHPGQLARRVAQTGAGDRLISASLRRLPRRVRERANRSLNVSHARLPGYAHRPNVGFVQSRFTAGSNKAREVIGYEPRVPFSAGMVPTARYLADYMRRDQSER
jgi:nucleoside-diphosphate-sugar epimerase/choline dehydrogenase-like flavoprotein